MFGLKSVFRILFWEFFATQLFLIIFFFMRTKVMRNMENWGSGSGMLEDWEGGEGRRSGISDIPLTHIRYATEILHSLMLKYSDIQI